jgi:hypothetical protein
MKYIKLTPHELALKTIKDINKRRKLEKEGQRQAFIHSMENRDKIHKRISHGRY